METTFTVISADNLSEEENITPIFTIRDGIQVQFVKSQPYATQAQVIDPLGMRYTLPVRYENNQPIALEEIIKNSVVNKEWRSSNLHMLDQAGKKYVYVGKQGLMGGIDEDDCPYQAKVSTGSSFTTYNWGGNTNRVRFQPSGGYWQAWVRHGSHYLSSDNDKEWH
jgi:hypothetical protein